MQIHELGPRPEYKEPVWIKELGRFWRHASDTEKIHIRVALKMQDRDAVRRLLQPYSDQAIAEAKNKKKKSRRAAKSRRFQYGVYGGWFYPGFHNDSGADSSSDGADAGGGESIQEQAESDHDIIQRFAASCARFLKLNNAPAIKLRRDPEWTQRHGTFGRYTAGKPGRIELATSGRHIIDILRTLAHEMTHAAQNERTGLPDHAGETGSEFEDGANAMAGRIMRHWAESEPEMFSGVELEEDWRQTAGAAAAAACIAGTPGCATTGTTAADALRTIQTIGRTAQNLPTRAGAEEELRQAVKDRLRRERGLQEASGYIPTAAEKDDPRFSMALTRDIRPGETGKQANKLGLKTDSQGRPALLMKRLRNLLEEVKLDEKCWTGYRQAGMKKKGDRQVPNCVPVEEDQELTEVDMSPGALKRWAQSDAAQRVRVGFEFEMYFPNTSSDDSDDDDPYDYDPDRQANSIQDVIDFFSEGNNPSPRGALNRLEAQMYEQYSNWRQEMIDGEMTESGFFEFMDEMDDTEEIRTDKQAEFRLQAEEELGDEAGRDEITDRAQELWVDWVDTQWNRGDSVYMEQYRDQVTESLEENFDEEAWLRSEFRYMSDVANEWSLEWPHMNERYREGGQDPDAWADELSSVIGMPVKTGSYHGTRRGESHANLEYDSSLDSPESDEDAGLELITPYRPLPEALQILDRVIEYANRMGIYTNKSTGLHMNVSLEDVPNVDWVKLIMFLGDTYILDTFERRANTYARSSMQKLMDKVRERRAEQDVSEAENDRAIYGGELDIDRAMGLMRGNMIELAKQAVQAGLGRDKYQSVHVKPLGDGGSYIEFRGPGGDWLGKQADADDVLRNTVFRLGRAMEIAADPEAERREYAKKLYKTLTPEMPQLRSAMQLFAQYSAGDINREQLKREWAEAVLQAERNKIAKSRNNEGIYKIVDNTTGEVLDRYEAGSDGEALEYAMSNWAGRGYNYDIKREVRDTEATPKEKRRRDLARRVAGKPTWWRVSVTDRPQYTGWIQAPTKAKAIQDYERRTGIEGTYNRSSFETRVEEPAPLRDPGAAPNTIRGRTFYRSRDFRRDANWALVDADGTVRIAFPAADQQAAEDRLRSWQSEEPDQERWLVSLQPMPDIRASDPEWRVTWVKSSGESMTIPVRAANEQQAIDLAKMSKPSAAMSRDIRAEREGGEPEAQAQPSFTATSINQPGPGESDWQVTWDEYRERDGERVRLSDAIRVVAASAQEASMQLMRSLEAQGRNPFNINAEPTDPPPWRQNIAPAGEPIPGSTLDIQRQRQRQQATQQRPLEFSGRWLVRSTVTGETVHTISGIGNVQADANRQAARWAQSTGFDDGIEVVPEMQ